jgi:hypothetical protein
MGAGARLRKLLCFKVIELSEYIRTLVLYTNHPALAGGCLVIEYA